MELTSFTFLMFAVGVVVASNCFPSAAGRSTVLAISSALFVASFANETLDLLPLGLLLLTGYLAVRMMQRRPPPQVLGAAVIVLVLLFLYFKHYSFLADVPVLPFAYVVVGMSYMLFRILHLAVDSYQGGISERLGPFTFFNYTCNFLTFVSGPIQRYEAFVHTTQGRLDLDDKGVGMCFSRIVGGYVKVAVISAGAKYVFDLLKPILIEQGAANSVWMAAITLSIVAAMYLAYLYYNFSGYMDIVIGIGGLVGLHLPENFDKPFTARNFLEFWSRWHMTLSAWFKTYVFNPLLKAMAARVHSTALQPLLGVAAVFATFLLMGIWHGSSSEFLIYGLTMGAGASINQLWLILVPRIVGKQGYKKVSQTGAYQWLSTGMTVSWFAFGLTCFWLDLDQIVALATALGASGAGVAFVFMSGVLGFSLWSTTVVARVIGPVRSVIDAYSRGVIARNLVLGTKVFFIVMMVSFLHKAPEFVYRAF